MITFIPVIVGCFYQAFEVIHRSVLGIHCHVITDRIVTAERSFPVLQADRVDGHQPQDVDAHLFQAGNMLFEGPKGSFNSVLPDVTS
jgi:hypothetical protein